jgi:hypothetical protein
MMGITSLYSSGVERLTVMGKLPLVFVVAENTTSAVVPALIVTI